LIGNFDSREDGLLQRLELGDLLVFLYALAFARQYLWIVHNNSVAWLLTVVLALAFSYCYVSTKQFTSPRTRASFWLIVGVPLLIAYALRAPFPDHSYDVWSYHILQSDRALHGGLYGPGDYFPTALPFNPISDMVDGLSRLALGYRLGTIINLFVLLWSAQIGERILSAFIERPWLRYVAVLLILLTENVLFEISTYMVDLLTIPLLLQATFLTLNFERAQRRPLALLHVALLVGASVAFKLTNLAVAIPLLAVCGVKLFVESPRLSVKQMANLSWQMLAAFVAPVLPFTIYIYHLTRNPIFPIANSVFQSPFWPIHSGWDDRWGPQTFWQTLAWPVLAWFRPERYSELGVYSGRLSLGFVVALIVLPVLWRHTQIRWLCILVIMSALLWTVGGMGYSRYGLFADVLGGILLCAVVAACATRHRSWKTAVAAVIGAVFVLQTVVACQYSLNKEWGERTTLIKDPDIYAREAAFILRDHSLRSFLTDDEKARFDQVQVWFETGPKSTVFEVLLNRRAPVIALREAEFFHTREAWHQFIQKVEAAGGQNMYSLCFGADLENAKRAIAERGLELGQVVPVEFSFFSPRERVRLMFLGIRLPQDPAAREQFENAWLKAAFAAPDYSEEIVALNPPSVMRAGEKLDVHLKLKNLGSETWPATGTKDFKYLIDLGNRWIRGNENKEDTRAVLKADLPPGGETELMMTITAPSVPGDYVLEFDMVHEGVTWFKGRGGRPLSIDVSVKP
jgi:hypothetical protein